MSGRTRISSGTHTEKVFGYSRAVRVGDFVSVAGTTAMTPDGPVGGSDVAEQTRECIRRIEAALKESGAGLEHVVRSRVFVTDITTWQDVGRVHAELLADALPAATIVEIARLFDPRLLVEIEADAIVG
jgi:enamine deaminase RidA (YjgF/YER057c/UK114 family)